MTTAHALPSHPAVGTKHQALGRYVLQRQPHHLRQLLRAFYLESVVINYANANFLAGDPLANGFQILRSRTFRFERNDVCIHLVQHVERRLVGLHLGKHPLLRWIAPTGVAPHFRLSAQSPHRIIEDLQHEFRIDDVVHKATGGQQMNLRLLHLNYRTSGMAKSCTSWLNASLMAQMLEGMSL